MVDEAVGDDAVCDEAVGDEIADKMGDDTGDQDGEVGDGDVSTTRPGDTGCCNGGGDMATNGCEIGQCGL